MNIVRFIIGLQGPLPTHLVDCLRSFVCSSFMEFFKLLLFFLVICSAKLPRITVLTKKQVDKRISPFAATIIKLHYVLRCPRGDFNYYIHLIESDVEFDDWLDQDAGSSKDNATYGLIDTWDTNDKFSEHFEFTVRIHHNCRRESVQDVWYEAMRCFVYNKQCQFYFDVNLMNQELARYPCNDEGNCRVLVDE